VLKNDHTYLLSSQKNNKTKHYISIINYGK